MKKSVFLILILAVATACFSQTGAGGIGNNTSNVIWLPVEGNCYKDAGVTPGANGDDIQQWNDISGNTNNATETTNSPNLKTNALNGFSTLTFDGVNERILASGVATNSQLTIFIVVKFTSFTNTSNDGILQASPSGKAFSTTTTDKSIGMWVETNSGKLWGRGVQSDNTIVNISKVKSLSTGQFYIITQSLDGSNITQYVDGSTAGSVAYDGTLKDWSDFGIGRQGDESIDGEIAEVIAHKVNLNTAQRIITDNYMAAKYGLTLTSNDLYAQDSPANGNYDYEVAGIGRIDASNLHNDAQGSGIIRILNPSNLDDNEFLIWGHDNGIQQATETTDVPATVVGRFERVWRVSEVNTSSTAIDVGSIDIQFDLTDLGSVTASDLRLLIDTDNDGVFSDETPISGASSIGSNVYQFAGVSAIANNLRFTLGTIDNVQTPLPIELVTFNAEIINNEFVRIFWQTASETNNDYFTIERSKNNFDWNAINTIDGAGNSNMTLNYDANDYEPYNGISYYRLKQTDFDGKFSYSDIISVDNQKLSKNQIDIYPNPTTNKITLSGNSDELEIINVYNILGEDVTNQTILVEDNNEKIVLDLSKLSIGIYFIKTKNTANKVYKQ